MALARLGRWGIAARVLPLALAAAALKYGLHLLDWEVISLSPLFSGLLAASIFLIGFLISGVLTDFKESEKLPGELAASLEAIADEAELVHRAKRAPAARESLEYLVELAGAMRDWFHNRESSDGLFDRIAGLNHHIAALEPHLTPNFVARLKQEQSNLRRLIIRIRVVRETSFIQTGYVIAQITSTLLVFGLLLARIDPFYESLFFVGLVTFVLSYLLRLIRDLDDPFEHDGGSGDADEVSLKPLGDVAARLKRRIAALEQT